MDAVALYRLLVAEAAVANLGHGKVEKGIVVVLPYERTLGRVDNDGAVKDDPDAPGRRDDLARAVGEQVARELR